VTAAASGNDAKDGPFGKLRAGPVRVSPQASTDGLAGAGLPIPRLYECRFRDILSANTIGKQVRRALQACPEFAE